MKKVVLLLACVGAAFAWQSPIRLEQLDHLAAKASDVVNITLDGALLHLASTFISDDDDEDAEVIKKVLAGVKGISVRSFEFNNTGEYLDSDVESIRSQLRDPAWKRIIEIRSKVDGNSDVYLKYDGNRVQGLTVIDAEPKELTVISIDGSIDLEGLKKLGGNFGIPKSLDRKLEQKKNEDKDK